ncbi:MAG: hypothetical protein M3441_15855 [Chloroflexota bacterium]|nr:hypothetical protein [Chloroflexota bacterium]
MIKLTRIRSAHAFPKDFTGEGAVSLKLTLLEEKLNKGNAPLEYNEKSWGKAKEQLATESFYKCAYCEAPTSADYRGDVEHFRPKKDYWWLAYCYDNYMYSCLLCNQAYKKTNFPTYGKKLTLRPPLPNNPDKATWRQIALTFGPDPVTDTAELPVATFIKRALEEKPGLPDPYLVDPESFFIWKEDDVNKRVWLLPRNKKAATKRAFNDTVAYLGLNREKLAYWRWLRLDEMRKVYDAYLLTQPGDPARDALKVLFRYITADHAVYAGMMRYFVKEVWSIDLS